MNSRRSQRIPGDQGDDANNASWRPADVSCTSPLETDHEKNDGAPGGGSQVTMKGNSRGLQQVEVMDFAMKHLCWNGQSGRLRSGQGDDRKFTAFPPKV